MIVTIARQCGCGAVYVGKALADYFHIPFYTRKNLMEMARRKGVLEEMESFFDERPVDELQFAMSSYGEYQNVLTDKPLRVLANLVGQENCIIIGRCGNYIFRERKDLVSVFLHGAKSDRVDAICQEKGVNREDAKIFVEQTDDCRVAYHKYYTGLTWGNANDYDICLDSVRLGVENTAAIILSYIKQIGIE